MLAREWSDAVERYLWECRRRLLATSVNIHGMLKTGCLQEAGFHGAERQGQTALGMNDDLLQNILGKRECSLTSSKVLKLI